MVDVTKLRSVAGTVADGCLQDPPDRSAGHCWWCDAARLIGEAADEIERPQLVWEQTEAADTWMIDHDMGHNVTVEAYGEQQPGAIIVEASKVYLLFSRKVTGRAVLTGRR